MEGFTYTNIFETKGIEYLAIIAFFLVLVPFWMWLSKPVSIPAKITKSLGFLTRASLRIPQGLFFDRHHTWAHLEKSGMAKTGMDDFLAKVLGEVRIVNMKDRNERLQKGEVMATVQQNGKVLNIISPVSGVIVEVNNTLYKHPDVLLDDPYGKGWFYGILPDSWVADTQNCRFAGDAIQWFGNELARFKEFLMAALSRSNGSGMLVLQDGGELFAQPLQMLPDQIWQAFQDQFLENTVQEFTEGTFTKS